MGFNCGIIGLPNIGKSTLFNALIANAAAEASNYPFCTIEPNVGRIAVPDPRLRQIVEHGKSPVIIHTQIEFTDIAGLVRGASRGEGLGNQFLAHIREVDAVAHVLRCFIAGGVSHVEGKVDPLRDAEIVETELMLADLESLERRVESAAKRAQAGEEEAVRTMPVMRAALEALRDGRPARQAAIAPGEKGTLRRLNLLTSKPVLYVSNVDEDAAAEGNEWSARVAAMAAAQGAEHVVISAAIEAELARLPDEAERREFLASLGLEEPGLYRLIRAGYRLLDLITFFTSGPKENRAWTVHRGATAPQAAGVIHSDFERGFITAETISLEDFIACDGEQGAKAAGKVRQEGRGYVLQDGDIIRFRFNV